MRIIAFLFVTLIGVTGASTTQAQNCQPRPSAVAWLADFVGVPRARCYRVDYLFADRHEAWWCGGNHVIDFPPEFLVQSGSTLARHWYFAWTPQGALLWPLDTVRCLCNLASCQVRAWR